MTIQQVQYILAVYHAGSISKAADRLYVAQSNLSSSIRALEQELGTQIFVRNHLGARPTPDGLSVLEAAAQIYGQYEKMCNIAAREKPIRAAISGISYVPVNRAYSKLCLEFQSAPRLDLSYYVYSMDEAIEKLYLSAVDAAIQITKPDPSPDGLAALTRQVSTKGIKISVLARVPSVVRLGPQNPLYCKDVIEPADLQAYTYVGYCGPLDNGDSQARGKFLPNKSRSIQMTDRTEKNQLVANSTAYTIGLRFPPAVNQQYGFREYPVEGADFLLVSMLRKKEKPSPVISRYLELLSEELATL